MKSIATAALVAILATCSLAMATQPDIQERVVELPEISQSWYMTAVYGDWSEKDLELYNAFRTDPALSKLASQTIFTEWGPGSAIANSAEWRAYLGDKRPALLFQAPPYHGDESDKGAVIFFDAGDIKVENVAGDIQRKIDRHSSNCNECPLRPRPQPTPAPGPAPKPVPPPVAPILPTKPDPEPEQDIESDEPVESYIPIWAFLFPVLGAGAGLYSGIKQEKK